MTKSDLKLPCAITSGAIVTGILGYLVYLAITALLALVPAGQYAGLIKLAVIFASILCFGSATIAIAIGAGILVGAIVAELFD